MSESRIQTDEELAFAIFCIEAVAERLGMDQREAYALLAERTNVLDDYVVRFYDVLHTQDRIYIADDIIRELKAEEVVA